MKMKDATKELIWIIGALVLVTAVGVATGMASRDPFVRILVIAVSIAWFTGVLIMLFKFDNPKFPEDSSKK